MCVKEHSDLFLNLMIEYAVKRANSGIYVPYRQLPAYREKNDYDKTCMAGKVRENPCVTRMAAESFSDLSCMTGERHDDSLAFNVSHSGRKVWSSYYAFLVSTVHLMCNDH